MYLNDVQTTFRDRVIFDLSSANSGKPIFLYEGRPSTLRMDNTSNFICPQGYNYDELKYTLATKRTKPDYIPSYHVFAFSCKPCSDLFYSTSRGSWLANGTATCGKCRACPYGASCNGTIRARANFWGVTRRDKIEMIPCPKGYCCDREPCESYDSCRGHRTGRLCGYCSEGFTEGLSSAQCFPNERCNGASWMWPMFNIIKRLVKWSLWNVQDDEHEDFESVEYRKGEWNQNQMDTESPDSFQLDNLENLSHESAAQLNYKRLEESTDYNNSGGYIKVFFYFYQTVLLIRLSSYVSSSSFPNSMLEFFTPLLNFQFTNVWKCASEDLRPVKKVFVKNSVAFWVMGLSLLTYCFYRFVKCRTKGYSNDALSFDSKSLPVRLIGTVMHVLLLSYVSQTQFAVQLLNCVTVGDKSVLYIDGSVQCYQPLQAAVWLYFLLYIVFFSFSLLVGQSLLIHRLISWKEFMLSCFFPFFFLCYWFYRYLKHRSADKFWRKIPETADNPFKENVIYILRYPYRSRKFPNATMAEHCSENWEAFSIFRRFVLVVTFIFVKSFLLRAYLFFILSVVFLLAHVFVQPFKNDMVNKLDTISLAVIVLISGLSISEATYNNSGQLVPHSIKEVQDLQDWFLALIPFALLVIFLFPRLKHHFFRRAIRPRYRAVVSSDDEPLVNAPVNSRNATERQADEVSRLTV
ncbi:uncharacterized protein LOC114539341 [Dendronephthya gigantea]|uniref:uncharacterized protein LOC114539341 n=1 Tax=Dendronephthya gigantea TaxID=151771 RepID=UPI001068F028|nr:uncharacterized protein LOC114539341 [Dendronephthya gigantea]